MKSKKAQEYIGESFTIGHPCSPILVDAAPYMRKAVEIAEEELSEKIPVWHDLRETPDDLPDDDKLVAVALSSGFVGTNSIAVGYKKVGHDDEYTPYRTWVVPRDDIIAWCELPKFESL